MMNIIKNNYDFQIDELLNTNKDLKDQNDELTLQLEASKSFALER